VAAPTQRAAPETRRWWRTLCLDRRGQAEDVAYADAVLLASARPVAALLKRHEVDLHQRARDDHLERPVAKRPQALGRRKRHHAVKRRKVERPLALSARARGNQRCTIPHTGESVVPRLQSAAPPSCPTDSARTPRWCSGRRCVCVCVRGYMFVEHASALQSTG